MGNALGVGASFLVTAAVLYGSLVREICIVQLRPPIDENGGRVLATVDDA